MYEELINCLRMCAKDDECQEDCPMLASHGCWKMLDEAADAIAELSAAIAGYEATTDVEFVKEDGHERIRFVPKWISVNERLPEEPGRYLVCKRWDYGYGTYHSMSVVSFTDNLNKVDNYDFHGKKYKRPGWFDYDSEYGHFETGDDIIAWMPLPEPPKEETE